MELSNLKVNELVQIMYVNPVQLGTVDSGNEVLQILASTLEMKSNKSRNDGPCYGRRGDSTRAGGSRSEFNDKGFEPG